MRQVRLGAREAIGLFRPPLRPAPALHAERADVDLPRLRRQHEVARQHPVLTPALHDLPRLHVHLLVGEVLDRETRHVPGLPDDHLPLDQSLRQRNELPPAHPIAAVYEIHVEVFVDVRPGDPRRAGSRRRCPPCLLSLCDARRGDQKNTRSRCHNTHRPHPLWTACLRSAPALAVSTQPPCRYRSYPRRGRTQVTGVQQMGRSSMPLPRAERRLRGPGGDRLRADGRAAGNEPAGEGRTGAPGPPAARLRRRPLQQPRLDSSAGIRGPSPACSFSRALARD